MLLCFFCLFLSARISLSFWSARVSLPFCLQLCVSLSQLAIMGVVLCLSPFCYRCRFNWFRLHRLDEDIIASLHQSLQLIVEVDASPRIGSGIHDLGRAQLGSLPVGESLRLADLLSEEIGVQLLQAEVENTEIGGYVLNVDEQSWLKLASLVELQQVVVPGESYLRHFLVGQQSDDRWRQSQLVESEEIAYIQCAHLEQSHDKRHTFLERRACLRIYTENLLAEQKSTAASASSSFSMTLISPGKVTLGNVTIVRLSNFLKIVFIINL